MDVDQARVAGVLIEFENATPMIVDRKLYAQLVRDALKRTSAELEARITQLAAERKTERTEAAQHRAADPMTEVKRTESRTRTIAEDAHGANLDLAGRCWMACRSWIPQT